ASLPGPGLQLEFRRSFYQPISGRYRLGTLGRGWVSNWDISDAVQPNGDVLVSDAGVTRLFSKQANGTFLASPGDYATLVKLNDVYQLREKDGTVLRFRPDGKLDYEQDANGNRITAGYNG